MYNMKKPCNYLRFGIERRRPGTKDGLRRVLLQHYYVLHTYWVPERKKRTQFPWVLQYSMVFELESDTDVELMCNANVETG